MVRLELSSSEILFLGHFGWELARKALCMRFGWWKRSSGHHCLSLHGQMQWQTQRRRGFQLHSMSSSSQLWPCWPAVAQAHHQVSDCRPRKATLSYMDFSTSSHFAVTVWQQHAHGFSDWWIGDTSETPAPLSGLLFLAPLMAVQCLILIMNSFLRILIEVLLL